MKNRPNKQTKTKGVQLQQDTYGQANKQVEPPSDFFLHRTTANETDVRKQSKKAGALALYPASWPLFPLSPRYPFRHFPDHQYAIEFVRTYREAKVITATTAINKPALLGTPES